MSSETIVLRAFVVLLLTARTIYWRVGEVKALNAKPKLNKRTSFITLHILSRNLLNVLVFVQLLGLNILPFSQNASIARLGLGVCILAVTCSFLGRKTLGTNWTDSAESQIKKKHDLITTGIYKLIRHPIAIGYCLFIIGVELVVESWLVIPISVLLLGGAYMQSRKEEMILTQQFGKSYRALQKCLYLEFFRFGYSSYRVSEHERYA
ncbi:MAG TPA: isoprenylcysteine carboxylmethyltransferase family protein [Candidatus Saccharimonadales bacterium]|nr:isoprenylcysteine carboxylmethyltransferase family protein [Candidatus Saccharimonadales bacterium]